MEDTMRLKDDLYVDIQPAREQDAPYIIEHLNQVGGESDNLLFGKGEFSLSVEQETAWIRTINRSLTSRVVLAVAHDEIVGIGSLVSNVKPRIAHHGELAVSVKQAYWNHGIGRKIIKYLIQFAQANGVTEIIHLGVRADNVRAIRLYQDLGFEEVGRFPGFFKIDGQYYDEILMNLYLR